MGRENLGEKQGRSSSEAEKEREDREKQPRVGMEGAKGHLTAEWLELDTPLVQSRRRKCSQNGK